ncbi:acetoacetate decarboxylase family protein [Microbacterium sp. Sa4CUA7]|uniref:Acetoacetate decarboxylase family protein n=1 Tax=Microbacterium pullorum TaxID=2762236 RepID=A0ABR8S3Q6_9MICO|nr:acetoacetate decarboxylase family protein [Microbacterium pullorum]MBD7958108.1 acetoacetate decarboxylase family protein [Microbacterium pullorum]
MSTSYPPEPWHLKGDFAVGVFTVPVRDLPADVLAQIPAGARPLTVAGRAVVGVAAVRYAPSGMLAYDELLVALPVMHRGRLSVNIPQIWVTSEASQAGGRALWGIPKLLMTARREASGRDLRALYRTDTRAILAETRAHAGLRMPGVWTLPLPTLQRRGAASIRSRNSIRGRVHAARTRWTFGSSLSWLQGRRPVLSAAITDAAVVFGVNLQR